MARCRFHLENTGSPKPQQDVGAAEEPEQRRILLRRLWRRPERRRRFEKQLVDPDVLRIPRQRLEVHQHQQRDDDGAAPIGNLVEMERKPFRKQHDLDRHHRHRAPRNEAVQRQQHLGEDVGARRSAARPNFLPRPRHVRRIDRIADHLEREIGLHARAQVEVAVLKQRPAAVPRALRPPQIDGDLALQLGIDRLGEIVAQQNVFGREWWRRPRARSTTRRPGVWQSSSARVAAAMLRSRLAGPPSCLALPP